MHTNTRRILVAIRFLSLSLASLPDSSLPLTHTSCLSSSLHLLPSTSLPASRLACLFIRRLVPDCLLS